MLDIDQDHSIKTSMYTTITGVVVKSHMIDNGCKTLEKRLVSASTVLVGREGFRNRLTSRGTKH